LRALRQFFASFAVSFDRKDRKLAAKFAEPRADRVSGSG
jgi:hypothetical protein